jgi:SMI1 / KNR4 family (SUKH-1)
MLEKFNRNPPAPEALIRKLEIVLGLTPSADYVQFLRQSDGGEGFIGDAYVILWRIEELLEFNKAYEVAEYARGLLLFGSDGGEEAFAFDMRSTSKPIVSVPFIGMELKLALPVAAGFREFLRIAMGLRITKEIVCIPSRELLHS